MAVAEVAVGVVAGLLSGAFGIGGGLLTTPAIRLVLGHPALIAVGTPLLVIVPTTVSGALHYIRRDAADVRSGLLIGASGSLAAVVGATATRLVGGSAVLIVSAIVTGLIAVDVLRREGRVPEAVSDATAMPVTRPGDDRELEATARSSERSVPSIPAGTLLILVLVAGLYGGFLGLGGGFVLVPLLLRFGRMGMRMAVGTSLVAISVLAVPGALTHLLLGNVDARLALTLALGAVPGAAIGARLAFLATERHIRVGFATLLIGVATWLAIAEIATVLG